MMKGFSTAFSTALCMAALFVCAAGPVSATAAEEPTGTTSDTTATAPPADTSATEAPVTGLTPERIEALQATGTTDSSDDKSVFEKASDFVTDHAPYFIIGIVVLAAIIAGIFIMRGRGRSKGAASAAVPGAPADVPSTSEIRRRKRAAMQRSREEERLRRKAHMEGRQLADPSSPPPLSARLPDDQNPALAQPPARSLDPVEAEKQSARAQAAAGAVARSGGAVAPPVPAAAIQTGTVPAPTAPSQTAPTPGIITPGTEPDTVYTSPASPQAAPPVPTVVQSEQPTVVNELPDDLPEPPVEAPGLDARVGEVAAAFAGGAAGGTLAAKAPGRGESEPAAHPTEASADEAEAEQRLKAKVAEIRAEQGRPVVPVPEAEAKIPEPAAVQELSIEEELSQAESVEREIEAVDPVPPTPPGLAGVERRLQASSDERDRTLADAEERLQRIEQRAADAEKRAAFAERLAQLKIDESARERRMDEVMSGIDRAEDRAREAEDRAKSAERVASAALEETDSRPAHSGVAAEQPAQASQPASQQWQTPAAPAPEPPQAEPAPPAAPAPPTKSPLFGSGLPGGTGSSGSLNLNSATFEELREADLSVTQATRILAYRERFGGYRSVEDLEKVPGFPAELIESLRGRITV